VYPVITVLAGSRIEALLLQQQTFYRSTLNDMRLYDLVHVGEAYSAVPDGFGVDHQIRTVFTLIETSGMIGPHFSLETAFGKFLLEHLFELGLARGVATAARVPRRTYISADENVAFKFRHENILQASSGRTKVAAGLANPVKEP
jgi:hypothetical protein